MIAVVLKMFKQEVAHSRYTYCRTLLSVGGPSQLLLIEGNSFICLGKAIMRRPRRTRGEGNNEDFSRLLQKKASSSCGCVCAHKGFPQKSVAVFCLRDSFLYVTVALVTVTLTAYCEATSGNWNATINSIVLEQGCLPLCVGHSWHYTCFRKELGGGGGVIWCDVWLLPALHNVDVYFSVVLERFLRSLDT